MILDHLYACANLKTMGLQIKKVMKKFYELFAQPSYVLMFVFVGIPNGHGRKFLVSNPTGSAETFVTIRNATSETFDDIAYSSPSQIVEKW